MGGWNGEYVQWQLHDSYLSNLLGDVVLHVLHGHDDALLGLRVQARLLVRRALEEHVVRHVRQAVGELGAVARQLRVARRLVQQLLPQLLARHCTTWPAASRQRRTSHVSWRRQWRVAAIHPNVGVMLHDVTANSGVYESREKAALADRIKGRDIKPQSM